MDPPMARPHASLIVKRSIGRTAVACLCIAGTVACVGHAGVVHLFVTVLCVLCCVLVGVWSLILSVYSRVRAKPNRTANAMFQYAVLIGCASLLSYAGGVVIGQMYMRSAIKWCTSQLPLIDEYRTVHGQFPSTLDQVVDRDEIPWTARALEVGYSRFVWGYRIDLQSGGLSGYCYDSLSGRWNRF